MTDCFIDTMGFYSVLDRRDAHHRTAVDQLRAAGRNRIRFLSTDYVLDETATLLKVRGLAHIVNGFFDLLDRSEALQIIRIDVERFDHTRQFFLKHLDQAYSFTDCSSFVVMREFGISDALTHDHHFTQAGFNTLLT